MLRRAGLADIRTKIPYPSDAASQHWQWAARSPVRGGRTMSLLVFLLVGAIAGWLAGLIVRGFGFGLIGNIVVGIIGALVAGYLFPRLGIGLPGGMIGEILSAVVGAVIVLVIVGFIRRV
jgi:uncharacterized membrane protein YeaQ/YmgE (transglycosylase-associated protein family)